MDVGPSPRQNRVSEIGVVMSSEGSAQRFDGQVAVVTGGASGIGEATVRRLLAEGASVVAGDLNAGRLEALGAELGPKLATAVCDVTDEADVEALVGLAVERFGRLDVGFNVAGAAKPGMIVDLSAEDWDFTVDICLKGVFLCMKHEARQLLAQGGGGAIVNVASLNSRVPMFGGVSYCAAKAGAAMLGECGALEWGESGIRVNTVSPGLTATPLTAGLLDIPGAQDAYLERIPMRAVGTPEHMASAALYLASSDAAYVSGTNLLVDGAWATSAYPDLRPFLAEATSGAS
jgi:NAD(P)-dependent dehydrogenase (short-subunit alcohol dehydrogenase family)